MATKEEISKLKAGAKIKFNPGGRGDPKIRIDGTFVRIDGNFVVTKDGADKERKVRPGLIDIL